MKGDKGRKSWWGYIFCNVETNVSWETMVKIDDPTNWISWGINWIWWENWKLFQLTNGLKTPFKSSWLKSSSKTISWSITAGRCLLISIPKTGMKNWKMETPGFGTSGLKWSRNVGCSGPNLCIHTPPQASGSWCHAMFTMRFCWRPWYWLN